MPRRILIDHRWGQTQIRQMLLDRVVNEGDALDDLAERSGLSRQHLIVICLGRHGISYEEIDRLLKALYGPDLDFLVKIEWAQVECFARYPGDDATPDEENLCTRLLTAGQREGKIPLTVWPEKEPS